MSSVRSVRMTLGDFMREHKHLLKVLKKPTPGALSKEHAKQKKEVEKKAS